MGLIDWAKQFHRRTQTRPFISAVYQSGWELVNGILHRTIADRVGTSVWSKDWDILVVLDATRVDTFREVSQEFDWIDTEAITSYWSVGSYSGSWVANTFDIDVHPEAKSTAYISGNDWAQREVSWEPNLPIDDSQLPLFVPAADFCWEEVGGVETVNPHLLTDLAITAWRNRTQYGFDKMIVHYMQPHQPFIGHPDLIHQMDIEAEDNHEGRENFGVWDSAYKGTVTRQEILEAYQDNLRYALECIDTLRTNVDANIAITADHGNALGELRQWGHPAGSLLSSVRKVPWTVIEGEDRMSREVDIDVSNLSSDKNTDTNVESRLQQLGYL